MSNQRSQLPVEHQLTARPSTTPAAVPAIEAPPAATPTPPTVTAPVGAVATATASEQSSKGKSAFDWDIYRNRRSALQHLRRQCTLVDTILETEDGSARELVHSQVVSAFGDKFAHYLRLNGRRLTKRAAVTAIATASCSGAGIAVAASAAASAPTTTATVTESSAEGNNSSTTNGQVDSGKLKLVRLAKVNRYTLGVLVECAYTGYVRTDLSSGGIWQVLEVAEHYGMCEVVKACCSFLVKNLNQSNCVQFYHIGIRHRHHLQRSAWHKIRASFKYLLAKDKKELQRKLLQMPPPPLAPHHPVEAASEQQQQQQQQPNVKDQSLASIQYDHFEALLIHDKLNIDCEEEVWEAIKIWCNFNLQERHKRLSSLLPCIRFPRLKGGIEFTALHLWRDPLVMANRQAQQQLAILDRNHRDFLANANRNSIMALHSNSNNYHQTNNRPQLAATFRDGFGLPCAATPRQLRPRIPHSILLAIGGWQQGQPTSLIESYDACCNLWFDCETRIMSPLAYHGIENINGLLYICGGTDGNEILSEVFVFDPIRCDCSQRPSMRDARCYVGTAHLEGHLYAMGGHNGHMRMKSVERLKLSDELVWQPVSSMNVARSDASACVHNSLIYIAGGLNDQVIESSVEFYNPADNTWTFATSMMTPRTSFSLLAFNNKLLAVGGNNGVERLNTVEQFDFTTKLWSHHSQMRHRRSTFSAAILDQCKLIVVGGYNGQTPFAQVEMWDETRGNWEDLHRIHFDRSGLKVVVVSDLPNAIDYTFLGPHQNSMPALSGALKFSQSRLN